MKTAVRFLIAVPLLLAVPAHANLTVHPMRAAVDATGATRIRIYSQSTQPQYIQTSLRRIVDAAGANEHEIAVEPDEAAIAITPGKFAMAGGGNRLVRVIPLQPVRQETAYRVYFEGVRSPDDVRPAADEGAQASIGMNLVWGALINVLPAEGTVQPRLQGGTLHNDGTLRLGVTSIAQCTGARCTAHNVSRSLYPGSSLPLPFVAAPGQSVQLRYRLTRDGHREHLLLLTP